MNQIWALLALFALLHSSAVPVSAGSVDIVSDESWTVEGSRYIGKSVGTWVHSAWTSIPGAKWIWKSTLIENPGGEESYMFVKEFDIFGFPTSSLLTVAADNNFAIILNGNFVAATQDGSFGRAKTFDLLSKTIQGRNVVQVIVTNYAQGGGNSYSNPAGLLFKLTVNFN
ncbi:unnamed protein product [Blepharisma stoltei]|uniref:Uncharacterized protein n=1 Tax=Blepharisma stoltei TaxID=1481888 RepID=A0AAU9K200_9CILI|nr:unnamed protein product [Blepharisma stoltei]